jgi:methylenetetrahydrofolate reductase (NADPH)
MGVREVFVVGGDSARPTGRFDSAFSLLRAAAESGPWFERVGIAGYPERHPLIEDRVLFQALLDKQPFAAYVVTQICFDARAIERWIHGARREGLRLPVYVGMPGLVTRAKLLEIALRIGVGDSLRYARKQGGLVARLVGRGAYRPNELVAALSSALRNGTAAGIHINTFNQVEATMRWVRGVLGRDGWWDIGLATEEPPA